MDIEPKQPAAAAASQEKVLYVPLGKAHQSAAADSQDSLTSYKLGNILFQQGRYENAVQKYRHATELDPNNALAPYLWVRIFAVRGMHTVLVSIICLAKI